MAAPEEDVIFVQTDPTFDLVLNAIGELRDKGRIGRTELQRAQIKCIERALKEGEDDALRYTWRSLHNFSKTAGVCFRMAMLEAMGTPRRWWPQTESFQPNVRADNMSHEPDPLIPVADEEQAQRYWSYYDRIYPHYYISHTYNKTEVNALVPLNSMMLIFRNNFTEMIEITTTVHLQKGAAGTHVHNARVHVVCIKREITGGDGNDKDKDTPAFQKLKALICKGEDAVNAKARYEQFIKEASPEEITKKMKDLKLAATKKTGN